MARGAPQLCLRLLESNLVLDTSLQVPLTCWCPFQTALNHTTQVHDLRAYMLFTLAALSRIVSLSQLAELSYFREMLYIYWESVKVSNFGVGSWGVVGGDYVKKK